VEFPDTMNVSPGLDTVILIDPVDAVKRTAGLKPQVNLPD